MPRVALETLDYRTGQKIKLYKSNIKRMINQGYYTIVYTHKGQKYFIITDTLSKFLNKKITVIPFMRFC